MRKRDIRDVPIDTLLERVQRARSWGDAGWVQETAHSTSASP